MRFVIAALIIFIVMKISGQSIKFTKEEFRNASFAGFLFLTVGNGLMCWALQYLDSGFLSLIVAAQPLVLILMIWGLQGKSPKLMSVLGTFLGLAGMYLLVGQNDLQYSQNQWIGLAFCFIALLAWGYASLFIAKVKIPESHFLNTGIQMAVGGILLLCISPFVEDISVKVFTEMTSFTFLCMLYLILFGSIIAFTSFNYLLQHVSPEKVATSTYVNPIVAVFLGWYFRDEFVNHMTILASFILFAGVYFINTARYKKS